MADTVALLALDGEANTNDDPVSTALTDDAELGSLAGSYGAQRESPTATANGKSDCYGYSSASTEEEMRR
jgi:hypothetical protein